MTNQAKTEATMVYLPQKLKKDLRNESKKSGISQSEILRSALWREVK